jgi:hypothetical protein
MLFQTALALLGGVIGAGLLRLLDYWREGRRARREYAAAIRLIRDEIRHNIGVCHAIGPLGFDPDLVEGLRSDIYASVRWRLAEQLPYRLRLLLARQYATLTLLGSNKTILVRARQSKEADFAAGARFFYGKARDDLADVDRALSRELKRLTHGKEVEVGPTELAGWQVVDAKTGRTPFDDAGKSVERITTSDIKAMAAQERTRMRHQEATGLDER